MKVVDLLSIIFLGNDFGFIIILVREMMEMKRSELWAIKREKEILIPFIQVLNLFSDL